MKIMLIVVLIAGLGFYIIGCGRSQQPVDEMQEPMSLESLGTISTEVPEEAVEELQESVSVEIMESIEAEPEFEATIIPGPPYNPTKTEIQTALKNAGFYEGAIDGKIGPMSKKAIKEFQKVNGLEVDGKVGPKTWGVLEKHLFIESSLDLVEE